MMASLLAHAPCRGSSVDPRCVSQSVVGVVVVRSSGHSDALVFTTWRLWFALPPLLAQSYRLPQSLQLVPPHCCLSPRPGHVLFGSENVLLLERRQPLRALVTASPEASRFSRLSSADTVIIEVAISVLGLEHARRCHAHHSGPLSSSRPVDQSSRQPRRQRLAGPSPAAMSSRRSAPSTQADMQAGSCTAGPAHELRHRPLRVPCSEQRLRCFNRAGRARRISSSRHRTASPHLVSGTTATLVLVVWAHRYVRGRSSPHCFGETPIITNRRAWLFFREAVALAKRSGGGLVDKTIWEA